MTWQVVVMSGIAAVLLVTGVALLSRLRAPTLGEGWVYAYRMVGIMLAAAGVVLAMSAGAMWSWSRS